VFLLKESALGASAHYLFEGLSKVFVEDGVDDRVERGVAVADPEEKREERPGDDARLRAHGLQGVGEEEREPAHHEDADDHRQDEREPLLAVDHRFAPRRPGVVVCLGLTSGHQPTPLRVNDHVPVELDRGQRVDPAR